MKDIVYDYRTINYLVRDKWAVLSGVVIIAYVILGLISNFKFADYALTATVSNSYLPPSFDSIELIFGTDLFGRSVLLKTLCGAYTAIKVGLIAVFISIPIGVVLGLVAGYFGGLVDDVVVWFYSTIASIPNIILLIAFTYVLGRGISSVYIALGLTTWIGLARLVRAEVMREKETEYVLGARALGARSSRIIFRHVLPNLRHLVTVTFSVQFIHAVKAEVILSFLGLGAYGTPSWGVMINDSKQELVRGIWWQLAAASGAMFLLVLAFNVFSDSFEHVWDPKVK